MYCSMLYPLVVILLARLFPHPVRKGTAAPFVSFLIPAYNEEGIIGKKIENTLALDYPRDRMEIIVISDGSHDRTEEIARRYGDRGVMVKAFRERQGKMRALLDALPESKGEILLFSDASGMLPPDAVRELTANFADERVGCVCGYYRSPALAGREARGELLYWDYEFALKRAQSRLCTLLGATGAMYAVRRECFVPPRPDTINDDFVIPALVALGGRRVVLEERAVVDDLDPTMGNFRSRVRVAAGNWQQLFYLPQLLSPLKPLIAWQYVSHKLLRMVAPILLILIVICSLVSVRWAMVPILIMAALSSLPLRSGRAGTVCAAARKLFAGCAAACGGMVLFFSGRGSRAWK